MTHGEVAATTSVCFCLRICRTSPCACGDGHGGDCECDDQSFAHELLELRLNEAADWEYNKYMRQNFV